MTISYVEPLTRAVDRMKRILFQPFDLVKWLVVGFSAWLAGLAGSGNGGTRLLIHPSDLESPQRIFSDTEHLWQRAWESAFMAPLVLSLVTLAAALLLLLLWVSSRGKFIFLDNVVHNRARIVEPWKQFRHLGNSLFLWRFGFVVVTVLAFGVIALILVAPAVTLPLSDVLRGLSFTAILLAALLAAGTGIAAAYVVLFLENFVVPIMYRFDLGVTAAWRAFLPWLRSQAGWFLVYGLFVICVAIPLLVVVGVLVCCTCCIIALPYIGTVFLLPVWVTYRLFGPEFLAQFDAGFDLFATPPLPVAETSEGM